MKNLLVMIISLTILSCSDSANKKRDNAILGDKVSVTYDIGLDSPNMPTEWKEGLKKDYFFDKVIQCIVKNKAIVYSPERLYLTNETISTADVKKRIGFSDTTNAADEMQDILFSEYWNVSNDLKHFSKQVNFWCPIRVYYGKDKRYPRKLKTFYVKPIAQIKGERIAESLFSEFDLTQTEKFSLWTGLDYKKFIDNVIAKVINGEIIAIDPIYIVDKDQLTLTKEQFNLIIDKFGGIGELKNNVSSLVFEEDWFFDENSMCFSKKVVSIGFVGKNWEEIQGNHSKFLFFIRFGNE